MRLTAKFGGAVLLLVAVTVGGAAWALTMHQRHSVRSQAHERARVLHELTQAFQDHSTRQNGSARPSSCASRDVLEGFRRRNPEYTFRQLPFPARGQSQSDNHEDQELVERFLADPSLAEMAGFRSENGREHFFVAHPLLVRKGCLDCHAADRTSSVNTAGLPHWHENDRAGVMLVSLRADTIQRQEALAARKVILILLVLGVVLLVLLFGFFELLVHRRLRNATQVMDQVAHDPCSPARIPCEGRDELDGLARSFNQMADRLSASHVSLEQRVGERTAELQQVNESLRAEIAERQWVEGELRHSEARKAGILETARDGVITLDHHGRILEFNPAAVQLFGRSREEALGERVEILFPSSLGEKLRGCLDQARATGRPPIPAWSEEPAGLRSDGSTFPAELALKSLTVEGRTFFVVHVHDLTLRKRLEANFLQAQKLEALGRLASGVAHDFNNLLTVINGCSEVLRASMAERDPSRGLVTEIFKAGQRATALTQQLLAFSRKQRLTPVVLDLNSVILDTEKLLRRLIGEDIHLTTQLGAGLRPIKVDQGQLAQVLLNLVVNSRDAICSGGTIRIETANVEGIVDPDLHPGDAGAAGHQRPLANSSLEASPQRIEGAFTRLTVQDDGCGMDEQTRKHLFEPFFTTKGPGKGTGLGLAMVYGVVTQLGGHIAIDSAPDRGTTFRLYFPQVDEAVLAQAEEQAPREPGGQETLLIVENDESVRKLASQMLRGVGYQVLEASNGTEALGLAERHRGPLHLLVSDIVLPGMNGLKLASCLSVIRSDIRLLFMSGHPEETLQRYGVERGSLNFLEKPFTSSKLLRKVREVLDRREPTLLVPRRGRLTLHGFSQSATG